MQRSIEQYAIDEGVRQIEITARQNCNDLEGKRIQFKKIGQNKYDFQFADKAAVECAINAIKQKLQSMPVMQQQIYQRLLVEFERRKSVFDQGVATNSD